MEGDRQQLFAALDMAGRESSTATVMFHTALAQRRGLSPTETKALDILLRKGPLTHAELGAETALAAASVTDLIDRLQAKGYVERQRHPGDKRRILVAVRADYVMAELTPLFDGWNESRYALYESYTDDQLAVILDFLTRSAVIQSEAAQALTAA
jgi:predicted transcriptional regulator